jgi:transcriptional regulator with XRE-family HTH domain
MPTRRVGIGPVGDTVRTNIAKIRKQRGMTLRDLSTVLQQYGHSMAHNTISEIELGARRVDVDDLVAFADALEVMPLDLLGVSHTIDAVPSFVLDQLQQIIKEAKTNFDPAPGGKDAGSKGS